MMTQLFLVGNQSERKYRKEQTCFQCAAAKSGDFSGVNDCKSIVKMLCESLVGPGSSKGSNLTQWIMFLVKIMHVK